MENPWAGGGGGGGGSGVASTASGGDSLGLVSSNGEKSCHAVDVLSDHGRRDGHKYFTGWLC